MKKIDPPINFFLLFMAMVILSASVSRMQDLPILVLCVREISFVASTPMFPIAGTAVTPGQAGDRA